MESREGTENIENLRIGRKNKESVDENGMDNVTACSERYTFGHDKA